MSHFAKVENGIVTQVIVAEQNIINTFSDSNQWIKTSYNMGGGVYYDPNTNASAEDQSVIQNDPARMRKNYAGIGYSYDETRDAFIPPKPFPSWSLNEESCNWVPPVEYPEDGNYYEWNEDDQTWDAVPNINIDNN